MMPRTICRPTVLPALAYRPDAIHPNQTRHPTQCSLPPGFLTNLNQKLQSGVGYISCGWRHARGLNFSFQPPIRRLAVDYRFVGAFNDGALNDSRLLIWCYRPDLLFVGMIIARCTMPGMLFSSRNETSAPPTDL